MSRSQSRASILTDKASSFPLAEARFINDSEFNMKLRKCIYAKGLYIVE